MHHGIERTINMDIVAYIVLDEPERSVSVPRVILTEDFMSHAEMHDRVCD